VTSLRLTIAAGVLVTALAGTFLGYRLQTGPSPASQGLCETGIRRCNLDHVEVCTPAHQWKDEMTCSKMARCKDGKCVHIPDCVCVPGDPLCACN
jgi:hypothetical protein